MAENLQSETDPWSVGFDEAVSNFEQSAESQAETIGRLEAYFGDQLFKYGEYEGTITEIINRCPHAETILLKGFDAMVDWVSPFTIDKTDEIKSQEDDKNREVDDKDVINVDDTAKTPAEKTIAAPAPEAFQSPVTLREDSIQQAINHAKQIAEESAQPVPAVSVTIVEQPKIDVVEKSNEIEAPLLTAAAVDATDIRNNPRDVDEHIDVFAEAITSKQSRFEIGQSVVNSPNEAEETKPKKSVQDTEPDMPLSEVSAINDKVVKLEVIVEKVHTLSESASVDTTQSTASAEAELLVTVEHETDVVAMPDVAEMTEQENDRTPLLAYDEIKEVTIIDSGVTWSNDTSELETEEGEIIKADAEAAYTDIAGIDSLRQLNEPQYVVGRQGVDESIDALEVLGYANSNDGPHETILEEDVIEVHEKLYIKQNVIIDEIANMVGEQPTEQLAPDATYIAIEQAQKIEQSIVLLNHAKTGQECADHLREVREELAGLLHVLGYNNVDMLVERLLKIYDIKTLRQFMVNLVIANNQAQQAAQQPTVGMTTSYYIGRYVIALLHNMPVRLGTAA